MRSRAEIEARLNEARRTLRVCAEFAYAGRHRLDAEVRALEWVLGAGEPSEVRAQPTLADPPAPIDDSAARFALLEIE